MKNCTIAKLLCFLVGTGTLIFSSCSKFADKDAFVINEVMAKNKTGLLASDGRTHDWIEIRNISGSEANLGGFVLEKDSTKSYTLPDTTIQSGECIVIFATKKKLADNLCCGFKLDSKNCKLQLKNSFGTTVSEVKYKKLKSDQSLALTDNDDYDKTYDQTPGFTNDEEGRKQYFDFINRQRKSKLQIWEYENSNQRWIELKNISKETVDLSEYSLTNDIDETNQLALPKQSLAPGALYCLTDTEKKLKGSIIILTRKDKFADAVNAEETYQGVSIGRIKGKLGFYYFNSPTPNAENTNEGFAYITKKPKLDVKAGAYNKKSLTLTMKTHGSKVHYTLDGTEPTKDSPLYKDKIVINDNTILRAFAEDSDKLRSPIVTSTYILNAKHTLPIICLTVSDSDLYDYNTGIYAEGPNASPETPHLGANYWKDWEKPAHVEFCDGKEGFSYDCGIKIFGAFSRQMPKKSFHVKFHGRYGKSHIEYDLYNDGEKDKVKSFVLRSGSQDANNTMVRDEFFTSLMHRNCPNLYVQAYRPVVLYVNAKYFGVYFIREKINEEYVANHLNVSKNTVTLLVAKGAAQIGNNSEYRALEEYARTHSMKDETAYKYMDDHIDFMSLIDYKIGEYYTGNCDVGNIRFFKSSDKKCDNKWHWLYYDLDWGFYYYTPLNFYIRESVQRADGSTVAGYNLFISRLLQNPKFREMFLRRWAYHMQNTFSEKNALGVFNDMIKTIEPEMEHNCERWPMQVSYKNWQRKVNTFRQKITERPAVLHQGVLKELGVTEKEQKAYFSNIKNTQPQTNTSTK